jgi:type II secretory pathway pseudopilin PulG
VVIVGGEAIPVTDPMPTGTCAPRAFTLIETMLVIVLVTLLLTLSLPSIASARRSAVESRSIANLRSHAAVFQMYCADWRDLFPYFTDPAARYTTLPNGVSIEYFRATYYWHVALADGYYESRRSHDSFYPNSRVKGSRVTPYWYSQVLIADPRYWNPRSRTGPGQWRPVAQSEALFPAGKVLLANSLTELSVLRPYFYSPPAVRVETCAVDGSASVRVSPRFHPGYSVSGNPNGGALPYVAGSCTLDGARGRDYR